MQTPVQSWKKKSHMADKKGVAMWMCLNTPTAKVSVLSEFPYQGNQCCFQFYTPHLRGHTECCFCTDLERGGGVRRVMTTKFGIVKGQADVLARSNIELQVTFLFTRCMSKFHLNAIWKQYALSSLTWHLERRINDQGGSFFYIWLGTYGNLYVTKKTWGKIVWSSENQVELIYSC